MMMRRRMGRALVAAAVVGGVAHHAGKVSAQNDAREQQQSAQIADLQAQQDQIAQQQQMAQQPQYAPPRHSMPRLHHSMRQWQRHQPPPQRRSSRRCSSAVRQDRATQELGELKASGILTEEEFQAEKAKILNG